MLSQRTGALRVRRRQLAALQRARLHGHAPRVSAFLQEYLPHRCAHLSEEALERAVQHGMRRAQDHGLSVMRDVTRFVAVMFVLGVYFEDNPSYPWAGDLLAEFPPNTAPARVARLVELAAGYAAAI